MRRARWYRPDGSRTEPASQLTDSRIRVSETLLPRPRATPSSAPGGDTLGLLRTIDEPSALRCLPREQLAEVARELRDELIDLGAAAGGHFAASLGAVE